MVDIFTRELAFLLWTIEGDVHMRAHNGVCFMYHEQGCYQPYSAIPPDTLRCIKCNSIVSVLKFEVICFAVQSESKNEEN